VQKTWPVSRLVFVYFTKTGIVLLMTRAQAMTHTQELFRCFCRAVLREELPDSWPRSVCQLDLFKEKFDPPSDGPDMEMVRIRSLHLLFPPSMGRRKLKLESQLGDGKFAIMDTLREAIDPGLLSRLQVVHVELQLRMKVAGGSKDYLVKLWRHRVCVNYTPFIKRLYACLTSWGVFHVAQP
jgi:hypothetical protein